MCRVTDTMKNKDGTASFSETGTKIQRCNVKALIIAMTKKSQYSSGEQQEKPI